MPDDPNGPDEWHRRASARSMENLKATVTACIDRRKGGDGTAEKVALRATVETFEEFDEEDWEKAGKLIAIMCAQYADLIAKTVVELGANSEPKQDPMAIWQYMIAHIKPPPTV